MSPHPHQFPPFQNGIARLMHVFKAMGSVNEVKILLHMPGDVICIPMLNIKTADLFQYWIGTTPDIDPLASYDGAFEIAPHFFGLCCFIHKIRFSRMLGVASWIKGKGPRAKGQ
jgi:hypothetical protein